MAKVEGKLAGEITFDSIKYSEIFTRVVTRNNETSGKITLPYELIDKEIVVILPIKKRSKKRL